jgi:hypothetical protein
MKLSGRGLTQHAQSPRFHPHIIKQKAKKGKERTWFFFGLLATKGC